MPVNRNIYEVGVFLIVMKDDHILFARDKEQTKLSLPGGGPHEAIFPATENVLDTGVREAFEEGCVVVKPTRLIGLFSLQEKLGFLYIFEGRLVEELPFIPKHETVQREWVHRSHFFASPRNDIQIHPAQQTITRQYLRHLSANDFPLYGSYKDPISIGQYDIPLLKK